MSKEIPELTDENFQATVSKGVTLVDFHADWCGPCRMMTPIIADLATELAGSVQVVKVNTENAPKTTMSHNITSIPCFIALSDGVEFGRMVGVRDKKTLKDMVMKK